MRSRGEFKSRLSVAMECRKKFTEKYEIHVCFTSRISDLSLYNRLRFGLLASTWFPRPLGIALWSVLHVLLIVGGSALLLLAALTFMLLATVYMAIYMACFAPYCALYIVGFIAGALCFVLWNFYVSLRVRGLGICGPWLAPETWSGSSSLCAGGYLKASVTRELRNSRQEVSASKTRMVDRQCHVHVGRSVEILWRMWCLLLTGWCGEVVHKHDAI